MKWIWLALSMLFFVLAALHAFGVVDVSKLGEWAGLIAMAAKANEWSIESARKERQ